jgi:NAD(P)-dependent dehydrogenase (short-subunit alcohol dehydrogenase family)
MNSFSLEGKVAVVTGALGLLGRNHCDALAGAGANVVACDLDGEACWTFAEGLARPSLGVGMDVTQKESTKAMLELVLLEHGHVDVLVNNAAINDMFETPKLAADQSSFENYP